MKVGDVVLVQDSNTVRGKWKMARVFKTSMDDDGKVRKVIVEYKNLDSMEHGVQREGLYTDRAPGAKTGCTSTSEL